MSGWPEKCPFGAAPCMLSTSVRQMLTYVVRFFLRGGDAENVTARYSEGKPLGSSRDCRLEK